jgi:hypothetical protein
MTEVTCSSETPVAFQLTTRPYILQDRIHLYYCCYLVTVRKIPALLTEFNSKSKQCNCVTQNYLNASHSSGPVCHFPF